MDALNRLIELAHLQAGLDLRCRLEGGFAVDHAPSPKDELPFHLVLDGECLVRTDRGRQLRLQAGDFLLLPRGEGHVLTDPGGSGAPLPKELGHDGLLPLRSNGSGKPDLDLLCGRFTCAPGPAALLLDTLPDPFHVSLSGMQPEGALKTIVALIRDETEHRHPGALTIVSALCHALFAMALRAEGSRLPDTPSLLSALADPRLGASVRAVFAAPARRWTIDELARLAAMSRPTYARRFKEAAGATVGDFITGLRMAIASDLLLRTQRGVADIGVEVGYESEAAFGKAFRASKGLTPARYRQQQRLDREQAG